MKDSLQKEQASFTGHSGKHELILKQLVKILLLIPLSFGLYAGEIETLLEETKETPKTADPAYLESLETLFQVIGEQGNSPEYFIKATLCLMDFNEEFQVDSLYLKEKIAQAQKLLPQVRNPSLKGGFYTRSAKAPPSL